MLIDRIDNLKKCMIELRQEVDKHAEHNHDPFILGCIEVIDDEIATLEVQLMGK